MTVAVFIQLDIPDCQFNLTLKPVEWAETWRPTNERAEREPAG